MNIRTKRTLLIAGTVAALAGGLVFEAVAAASSASVGPAASPATLSLSASGQVITTPDQAFITIGVTAEDRDARGAMRRNRSAMARMIQSLAGQGVAQRAIQTSSLRLEDFRDENDRTLGVSRIKYRATNLVTVRVDDLRKLGAVVDLLVGDGANQIHGVTFDLKEPEAARDEARRKAFAELTGNAALYAQAGGYRAARLVSMNEQLDYRSRQVDYAMAAPPSPGASTAIEGGELTVRVNVSASYALVR